MITEAVYTLMFYLLTAVSVFLALRVVLSKSLLRAAIALMVVLVAGAGFYAMLGYEFLAGVQILVYVGGIAIFIIFAIMLTATKALEEDQPPTHRKILGGFASLTFFGLTTAAFLFSKFPVAKSVTVQESGADALGQRLLSYGANGYVIPFELISLLLLAAVIGGIVVGRKVPPPGQPFTSGGDLPGEVDVIIPKKQLLDQDLPTAEGDA